MKVFISWSGRYSKECAEFLRDWIKCILQASNPWISSRDIDKGALWFSEISNHLEDTEVGIVCLTKDNKDNPWILFESGALAKGLSVNRVCTLLINLKPSDIQGPLAQFNHTTPDKVNMKVLISTINDELGVNALEERILDQVFEIYWPSFKERFEQILQSEPELDDQPEFPTKDEILEEILYTTRAMDRRVRSLEMEKTINVEVGEKTIKEVSSNVRRTMTIQALELAKGNKSKAAELLDISRQAIQQIITDLDIDTEEYNA